MSNPIAKIPMVTLLADAVLWPDVAQDRTFRMEVHEAMLQIDPSSAPRYAYLKAPESIWGDLHQELRVSAMVERAHARQASLRGAA